MPRQIDPAKVRVCLDAVIDAMRRADMWDIARPADTAFEDMGAFGMRTMAFAQWLRWVFVPNAETSIASNGPWPESSSIAVQATREGDTDDHVARVAPALADFDALFEPTATRDYARAVAELANGDHDAALDAVLEALAADPTVPNGENLAGWILMSRPVPDLDRAIEHLRRGIRRDAAAITNLGDALRAANRPDDAVAELEALAAAGHAEAHNWLGWFFTAMRVDLARAEAHLIEATRLRPTWGVAWQNLAKALDAAGDVARACAAFGTAIACGDARDSDDAFARDRRIQLELVLRGRGEQPPPPPDAARADTTAVEILQAGMAHTELSAGRTFLIKPTSRAAAFAMICIVIEQRAFAAAFVDPEVAITLGRGTGGVFVFRRGDANAAADHLADWVRSGGADPAIMTPVDVGLALRDAFATYVPRPRGWRIWVAGDDPAQVAIGDVATDLAIRVRARVGGGVGVAIDPESVGAKPTELELPTPAALTEHAPAIVDAARRAVAARDAAHARPCGVRQLAPIVAEAAAGVCGHWRAVELYDQFPKAWPRAFVRQDTRATAIELQEDADGCAIRVGEGVWRAATADELRVQLPAIVAEVRIDLERVRAGWMQLHDRFRVIARLGPFSAGTVVELAADSYDPHGEAHTYQFLAAGDVRYSLTDYSDVEGPILATLYRYLTLEPH
jgi:uncharacterized protein YqcC (DUF446 family)